MKKIYQKTTYTSPEVELLELRSEGIICESITIYFGDPGEAGDEIGDGGTYNL